MSNNVTIAKQQEAPPATKPSRRRFFKTTGIALMSASMNKRVYAQNRQTESNPFRLLQPAAAEEIAIAGELQQRMQTLWQRLQEPLYQYQGIITCSTHAECPGDWYGRTLLALVLLSRSLKADTSPAEILLQRLPEQMNRKGYYGEKVADIHYDETKVASHNFLLRSLCAAYEWTHDQALLDRVDTIVQKLFLPLRRSIHTYPDHLQRQNIETPDALIGMQAGRVGRWRLCTDTGVLFFSLDGLAHALSLTLQPQWRDLVDTMISRFAELDLLHIKAQTHSTLTTSRALLRLYRLYGDRHYLDLARDRYELYRTHAWTQDLQNYNWFRRPQWTEGCAIIDSFMVAMSLWQETAASRYLHDAHLIYYTAMRHNQWPNGGYGTTNCLGADNSLHLQHGEEATWCCTMRGGEGLAAAMQWSYLYDPHHLVIPFYCDSQARLRFPDGTLHLRQRTRYPYQGECLLDIIDTTVKQAKTVWLFLPFLKEPQNAAVTVNGLNVSAEYEHSFLRFKHVFNKGDRITLTFSLALRNEPSLVQNSSTAHERFFHGPLMLGYRGAKTLTLNDLSNLRHTGNAHYQDDTSGLLLQALDYDSFQTMAEAKSEKVQFLFPAG